LPTIEKKKSSHIGSGAFGVCSLKLYRNIEVSVKHLKDSLYCDMIREAKIIKILEGHPNLPILLGISPKTSKDNYIVTKFHGRKQKGIPLWYTLRKHDGLFPIQEQYFRSICFGVSRGLLHIHIKGYLHNDLKTDNAVIDFIDGQPSPVIIDFGKSCKVQLGKKKHVPPEERESYSLRHKHIAPELIDGSHRQAITTDIYSLGILLSSISKQLYEDAAFISKVADKCTLRNPTNRPNMDSILLELKSK